MRSLLVVVALTAGCSLFVPANLDGEGEGEGDVAEGEGESGEGEGDVVVGEGEGDVVVGEGEGDIVVGEGEGEGDIVVGEGEGEGEVLQDEGCRDGSDEGFNDLPNLRACRGSWSTPSIYLRGGANTAADLCADGWHICLSDAEVAPNLVTAEGGRECDPGADGIFVTRQGSGGSGGCQIGGNDVFGCSSAPPPDTLSGCGAVNTRVGSFVATNCGVSGFSCEGASAIDEGRHLVHDETDGGVLCCRGAETNPCLETIGLSLDPEADAELGATPAGSAASITIGDSDAIVRFRSPQLYDGNFASADVVFGPSSPDDATFNVSTLDVSWDEATATLTQPSSLSLPWPGSYPGDPLGLASPNSLGHVAAVPVDRLGSAVVRNITGDLTAELNFVLTNPSAPVSFISREGTAPTTTKLRMNRCVRLASP